MHRVLESNAHLKLSGWQSSTFFRLHSPSKVLPDSCLFQVFPTEIASRARLQILQQIITPIIGVKLQKDCSCSSCEIPDASIVMGGLKLQSGYAKQSQQFDLAQLAEIRVALLNSYLTSTWVAFSNCETCSRGRGPFYNTGA